MTDQSDAFDEARRGARRTAHAKSETLSRISDLAGYVDGVRQSLVQNLAYGAIALGAEDVFYLQGTGIMKVAKTGGTPVLVTTTAPLFGANLAVDATSIYWFGDSIQKFPIGGGTAVTLVPVGGVVNTGAGFVVTQDETYLYWARSLPVPAAIVRVPKARGPVEPVVAARDVLAMAVRGTTLAWINVGQPPQATTIGSGLVTQLGRRVANDSHPGIAIDTAAVYVTSTFDGSRFSPVISRPVRRRPARRERSPLITAFVRGRVLGCATRVSRWCWRLQRQRRQALSPWAPAPAAKRR